MNINEQGEDVVLSSIKTSYEAIQLRLRGVNTPINSYIHMNKTKSLEIDTSTNENNAMYTVGKHFIQ